jgi:hypothetical protein
MKHKRLILVLATIAAILTAQAWASAEPNEAYRPQRAAQVAMLRASLPIRLDIVTVPMPGGGGGGGSFSGGAVTTPIDFNAAGAAFSHLNWNTVQTPDALVLSLGTTSRNFLIVEAGDEAFDFAHAQSTNPTLFVHSAAQSTTQWLGLYHDGSNGHLTMGVAGSTMYIGDGTGTLALSDANVKWGRDANGRSTLSTPANGALSGILNIAGSNQGTQQQDLMPALGKTLTESSATPFVLINLPASSAGQTGGVIYYTIEADDATDFTTRSGILPFAVVNKAGVETCTLGTVSVATEAVASSSVATLTNTFTCDTSPVNGVFISANALSSLTQTRLDITYRVVKIGGTGTIVPQ